MDKHTKKIRKGKQKANTLHHIQQLFFRTQIILIVTLALFLGAAGIFINIHFEAEKRDQNLQNIARTIAQTPILSSSDTNQEILKDYFDALKSTLDDIDVISIVNKDGVRIYHSNHTLINTEYDGTMPQFDVETNGYYTTDEFGPSGNQRRAYAAIYKEDGEYAGFVMTIMLMENIQGETYKILFIFSLITLVAVLMELIISAELFGKIKKSLLGYEPNVFTAMFKVRDNILESLNEGIVAVDKNGIVQFANTSAMKMSDTVCAGLGDELVSKSITDTEYGAFIAPTLASGEKSFNGRIEDSDILIDSIPIKEEGEIVGAIGILHNRAEYTKLMEDLTGTRYLVDSMRANNHDFTNKLHVILGLIQMEMYEEATSYIQNITMMQRATISKIMNAVNEPAVAALLIGKTARAAELNIRFVLREGCCYSPTDYRLPSEVLVTIIGNLLENAFESMNEHKDFNTQNELMFGIYSRPDAVLITVDDTGKGIADADREHIFENGFSTKGEGRGTGLYQVKTMVEALGGTVTVESQIGVGTSFSVSFIKKEKRSEKKDV